MSLCLLIELAETVESWVEVELCVVVNEMGQYCSCMMRVHELLSKLDIMSMINCTMSLKITLLLKTIASTGHLCLRKKGAFL